MAYNLQKIEFLDCTQYRIYGTPVTERQYMSGEKLRLRSDAIDERIRRHQQTPWGTFADEVDNIEVLSTDEIIARKRRSVISSTNRSKTMLYNYARSNEWDYFITLTFNKDKIDRYDYKVVSQAVRKWLDNTKRKYAPNLKYLLVPELHTLKKGETTPAWHFHGLISNTGDIKFTRAIDPHTNKEMFTDSEIPIFNFKSYKLGFTTATPYTR